MYYKDITLTGPQAAIGYEDENLPTRVIIDISDLTKYGIGTTVLEVKRPCDREAYIAEQTEVDGNNFYWYPTKGDLEVSGLLKCQVKAVIGDQIVKTRVYSVQVSGALNGDGTLSGVVPDALQTFVESASGSEDAAKASAEAAADSATSASESAASIKASADQIAANKKALQTPTTVTDPTSKTVLLAGSQGIDYDKLADAIIAKYQGQTLAGKAQSVKSALDLVKNQIDGIIDVVNGKPFENVRWSGEKLGSTFTAEQLAYIQNNEGYQLGLGSYWTDEAQGITWRNLDFNFLLNKGDSALNKYHSLVMPDACLLKADGSSTHYMKDDNTTVNTYTGTKYRNTYRSQCKTKFANFFGSHVLTHREMLVNSFNNGQATGWSWYPCDVELPSEDMIYGSSPWGISSYGGGSGHNVGINYGRIAGFESHPELINASWESYWLRTICATSRFAFVNADGRADHGDASLTLVGLRPYALIG